MAKMKLTDYAWHPLEFPIEGIDRLPAFWRQRKNTTPDAKNVRGYDAASGRIRGSQRPGFTKLAPTQVNGSAAVQLVDYMVGNFNPPGTGVATFGRKTGAGSGVATLIDLDGTTIATVGTAGEEYQGSIWTTDGYCVIASRSSSTIKLLMVDTAGTTEWSNTSAIAGADANIDISGLGIFEDLLYVATDENKIYRFNLSDGTAADSGAWFTTTLNTPLDNTRNHLAIAAGVVAVVGGGTSGKNLQLIDIGTATEITSLSDGYTNCHITSDGTNFYIVGRIPSVGGGPSPTFGSGPFGATTVPSPARLFKYSPVGDVLWTSQFGHDTLACLAYDAKNNRLCMVDGGVDLKIFDCEEGTITSTFNGNASAQQNVFYNGNGGFVFIDDLTVSGTVQFLNLAEDLELENYDFSSTDLIGIASSLADGSAGLADRMPTRTLRGIAVAGGTMKIVEDGTLYAVANGTTAFSTGAYVMFGAQFGDDYFVADGISTKYYDAATNTVRTWTPTAGTLPRGARGDRARLIAVYQGCVLLSGFKSSPYYWAMSKIGDAFDWDFFPTVQTPLQAVSGDQPLVGPSPDRVNALVVTTNDVAMFGCDHSVWRMTGHPNIGGRFDLVTDQIGIAWGEPFTMDDEGTVYALATRGGVRQVAINQPPVVLSNAIEEELRSINRTTHAISMTWDDVQKGINLWVTPLSGTTPGTHYFWERRTKAWWIDQFKTHDYDPRTAVAFDGDSPADRVVVIGCHDGYLRKLDLTSAQDDAQAIESYVLLGPILTDGMDELMLHDLKAALSEASDAVQWEVLAGKTPEAAFAETASGWRGRWSDGRNFDSLVQRAGHAFYVKLSNFQASERWAVERILVRLSSLGPIAQRA